MRSTACALATLLLAACGSGDGGKDGGSSGPLGGGPTIALENATPAEVAGEMQKSGLAHDMRQPGKWAYETTIVDIKGDGMPPGVLEQMKKSMGAAAQKMERCVTEEELAQADAFLGKNEANCTFDKYRVGGGKVEGEAHCNNGGVTQHMVMNGTFDRSSSDMTITSETGGMGPSGNMTMTMNIKSKRLGDCDSKQGG